MVTLKKTAYRMCLLTVGIIIGVTIVTDTTSSAGGVSVASEAQALAVQNYAYPARFDAGVQNAVVTLEASGSGALVAQSFYDTYQSASRDYATALQGAAMVYADTYANDLAAARATYVDDFTQAQTTFLTRLAVARSQLTSELIGYDNAARNTFVTNYDAAVATFAAQLQAQANELANLTT